MGFAAWFAVWLGLFGCAYGKGLGLSPGFLHGFVAEARRDSFAIAQKGSLRATGRAIKDVTPSSMLLGVGFRQ